MKRVGIVGYGHLGW